jgi:hypothetical protein
VTTTSTKPVVTTTSTKPVVTTTSTKTVVPTTINPLTTHPSGSISSLSLRVYGVIEGDVMLSHIDSVALSTSSIQGSLTVYNSPATITLTAFSNHIQGSLSVSSNYCNDVTLKATTVGGNVSWDCSTDQSGLTLPLVEVQGNLAVQAYTVNADLLHHVSGTINASNNGHWPSWSSASLNTVGGLVFHGSSDAYTLLSFPMLTKAGVVDLQVQGQGAIHLAEMMVVGDLSVVLNTAKLTVLGTINATGTVLISMLDNGDELDWNLIQGGDTTICDYIHTDASLDNIQSVKNLTLGGCESEAYPIGPQNLRSLTVILGTLRADLSDAASSYAFSMPSFPSLRSITRGLCFTSSTDVSVDLSPLLKASVSGTCYIQETIHLSSACPCREGCQHTDDSSCF